MKYKTVQPFCTRNCLDFLIISVAGIQLFYITSKDLSKNLYKVQISLKAGFRIRIRIRIQIADPDPDPGGQK